MTEVSPEPGKVPPATPSATPAPVPSTPPAPETPEQSNFRKIQESRDNWKTEAETLRKEKADREAKDKADREAKLAADGKLQELADAKAKEAADKAAEAASEKARADAAEAKVKAFEDQQEEELKAVLETIPKDKRPPLDDSDPVSKRLAQAKHIATLLNVPKAQIGGGVRKNDGAGADRKAELLKKGINALSPAENMELMALTED